MILELLLDIVAYRIGYIFIKIVTLGRFPKKFIFCGTMGVETVGVLVSVAILIISFYFIF